MISKVFIDLFSGYQDAQQIKRDAKVLRIYPPQVGNKSVGTISEEKVISNDSIQLNKNVKKWKSVGSGNVQNQPTFYFAIVPLLEYTFKMISNNFCYQLS